MSWRREALKSAVSSLWKALKNKNWIDLIQINRYLIYCISNRNFCKCIFFRLIINMWKSKKKAIFNQFSWYSSNNMKKTEYILYDINLCRYLILIIILVQNIKSNSWWIYGKIKWNSNIKTKNSAFMWTIIRTINRCLPMIYILSFISVAL